MKDPYLIISDWQKGWFKQLDESNIPIGGLQKSVNITLTDRGGISPRPGETLLGEANSSSGGGRSLYSFHKTNGDDILLKSYSTVLEYYSNKAKKWALLQNGYTADQEFGFKEHSITSADSLDWIYLCNGVDPYSRWCGWEGLVDGALLGGETSVVVDTVLLDDIYHSNTASVCSATTIDIASTEWATDIWNDYYVRITSGTSSGYISKVSATTGTKITFDAIAGLTGTPTFEIRRLAIPTTGTLVYGANKVAYTAVLRDTVITVASTDACDDGEAITVIPETFLAAPRGNILETNIAQMYVAGVLSAKQTVFRSHIEDASNFAFSSPRSADEGDVVYYPYNGDKISDIKAQEDVLYILKPHAVETLTYTQDESDVAQVGHIKQAVNCGATGRSWKVNNDILFCTADNRISSVGQVETANIPQALDLAFTINREVKNYNFDNVHGVEYNNRYFVCVKSTKDVVKNDRILVRNKNDGWGWEGYWQIPAQNIVTHKGKLYYMCSYTADVYEMETGVNKIKGTTIFPMDSYCQTGFINTKGIGFYLNEVSSLAVEGYITSGTTINFRLFKDFAEVPFQELQLLGTEEQYQDNSPIFSLLGGSPMGLEPLGASAVVGDLDAEGRRHFIAFLYFPITQVEYISVEIGSTGKNQCWEIIKLGLNAVENVFESQIRIK